MNPTLRNMVVGIGTFVLAGVGFAIFTPQPATRTTAELRDAGIGDGQKMVLFCPERLTKQTIRRINNVQPGVLRPTQSYARVARLGVCFLNDGGTGNCFRAADSGVLVGNLEASIIITSLRQYLTGVDLDASVTVDDAGDSSEVDNSFQFSGCYHASCNSFDDLVDAGTAINPYPNRFCAALNRLAVQPAPCQLPRCVGADGGWDDTLVVDCLATGPYGLDDGGARWRGCNVTPTAYSVGSQCIPVECGVVAGDVPWKTL